MAHSLAGLDLDALGINRYEPSSRYVDRKQAVQLAEAIRDEGGSVRTVGVYVNPDKQLLVDDQEAIDWDIIQLHGDETPDFVQEVAQLTRVMKAFRAGGDFSMDRLETYDSWAYLMDAYHPDRYGGTGDTAPWEMIGQYTDTNRIVLAGGLKPENVGDAIESVNPWGVDACSGVEDEEGFKKLKLCEKLIDQVNQLNGVQPGS